MNSYFFKRYSVRNFSNKEVSDSTIKALLEAASHAPTTGNMQLYSVIITRDQSKKDALAPAHFSQAAFTNAPVILTFCADFNRFIKWCEVNNADSGFNNIQSFISAALDTVILAQQFTTIAEMEGFGTCYLGTTTYNPQIISDVLELPKLVVPITTLAIGYHNGSGLVSDRLCVDAYFHSETYKDYSHEDINNIYSTKESLPENLQYVRENNKQNLAQVFAEIRYPKINNESFSKTIIEFLKVQGFHTPS